MTRETEASLLVGLMALITTQHAMLMSVNCGIVPIGEDVGRRQSHANQQFEQASQVVMDALTALTTRIEELSAEPPYSIDGR